MRHKGGKSEHNYEIEDNFFILCLATNNCCVRRAGLQQAVPALTAAGNTTNPPTTFTFPPTPLCTTSHPVLLPLRAPTLWAGQSHWWPPTPDRLVLGPKKRNTLLRCPLHHGTRSSLHLGHNCCLHLSHGTRPTGSPSYQSLP